jgi:cell division protein ZapA (FtsZ GTPase activity inhibitor)
VDCATVTALNLADTLFKERAATEDLRRQLVQALDEAHKAEQQLKEAQRGQRSQQSGSGKSKKK